MKINISIEKRHFYVILATILLMAIVVGVAAYNSNPPDPASFGHSASEVDGMVAVDITVTYSDCPAAPLCWMEPSHYQIATANICCHEYCVAQGYAWGYIDHGLCEEGNENFACVCLQKGGAPTYFP